MKITYIEHSCFSVEFENVVLLFDYYKGQLPEFEKDKIIYVFSSHMHHDHFNMSIFELLKEYPNIKYVFSSDIKIAFGRSLFNMHGVTDDIYEKIEFMRSNDVLETIDLKIETLNSTDEGVAFIVTVDGKTIYHAGDLNLWVWNYKDEDFNDNMLQDFEREIAKIKNRHFDAAFLVLDPRQGEWFNLGFDYFMKNTNTDKVYPMHFWNDNSVINMLKAMNCSEIYRERIISY
ncbi:L-ascorbate metabolism protein UlaG (beta-lactamase superfamily) [Clostridium saccharoperbutylacetonicum]|uniref:Putative Zn-dependent hydrolases of the beta-lactamase Fold protein n=1 Tax=Clostridium saccharoperbutylacetonicum N1-4(HMT) TaxID=931276 RepID=M1MHT2_9CLOT|nr:MBL fold metallo-hydrolase [Clostridium saccharoperbutylacetonicum]AGF57489.1 putative Zn-dependent hydrolases of the beta-lactamase Fold protein [Clostridium saccharoperbutylacetonicum N1-4(HMT)]NRT61743.1 L-ascorbate metabolism protein UlaG (beta-lactamase superfamily) [Clostridium saccharoperbutylacetonicum]NSB25068.1 L-ascorbate metabolism protein UlaG (beta-lactamase superfamily) [Clostridium saccharoperbutylacetonicum]NSB44437.1 L-ascorbate metabolism protein UlaG (beta-lactamase super